MTPERLREWAKRLDQCGSHSYGAEVELCNQLAAALEENDLLKDGESLMMRNAQGWKERAEKAEREIERLKGELTAMTTERNSYKINASVYKGDSENAEAALAAQSVKLKADEIAWHEQEEAIRDLRAERDALKRHAEDVKRDLAASVVKSAELEEENSKLRSALAIVHFKREPWQ